MENSKLQFSNCRETPIFKLQWRHAVPYLAGEDVGVRLKVVEPIINLEESIGKTVGKRRAPADSLKAAMALQQTVVDLHKAFGNRLFPRGVYRFRSHEEADAWTWKMLTRKR